MRPRFWSFQPDPRSDAARLQWLTGVWPAAVKVTNGDAQLACEMVLAAAAACDWGRCCPAWNWFGEPVGDRGYWLFCTLVADPSVAGGQRLQCEKFGVFSSAAAAWRSALASGVIWSPRLHDWRELRRLYDAAPQTIAELLPPWPFAVSTSRAGTTDPAQ